MVLQPYLPVLMWLLSHLCSFKANAQKLHIVKHALKQRQGLFRWVAFKVETDYKPSSAQRDTKPLFILSQIRVRAVQVLFFYCSDQQRQQRISRRQIA